MRLYECHVGDTFRHNGRLWMLADNRDSGADILGYDDNGTVITRVLPWATIVEPVTLREKQTAIVEDGLKPDEWQREQDSIPRLLALHWQNKPSRFVHCPNNGIMRQIIREEKPDSFDYSIDQESTPAEKAAATRAANKEQELTAVMQAARRIAPLSKRQQKALWHKARRRRNQK